MRKLNDECDGCCYRRTCNHNKEQCCYLMNRDNARGYVPDFIDLQK